MNKRLFTIGCSFTYWHWPTWNDYIGLNFDEYHSLGCGGADNRYILYKFLEADKKYLLISTDDIFDFEVGEDAESRVLLKIFRAVSAIFLACL